MKIGLITGEYPPQQGGVGDFTRELARALNALGHTAHVITGRSSAGAGEQCEEEGILVHRVIGSWGVGCWRQIADMVAQNSLEVLNIQYEPAAYAMQVAVNFLPGSWVRRMIKRPIVTTFHDLLVPYLFPKAGPLRWKVVEYLARHSDAVIITNAEDRAKLTNLKFPREASNFHAKRPISNLHVIPIGSNIDPTQVPHFDRIAERARWGITPDECLVGYFGFLNLSKGGADLMQAIRLVINGGVEAKLLLIGGRTGSSDPTNAAYAGQVDRLIESLSLRKHVITTGYLNTVDVSRALFACDVMALPYVDGASLRRGSLLAAIAHGRAIVTTNPAYPIEGLTQGQSALFVPPDNPLELAEAIQQVLRDADLRARLENGAVRAAQLYAWDRIAAQTVEVYRSVTSET